MKSQPRLRTPRTAPTVVKETVETVTTRSPARTAGPASGSSTVRKRRTVPMPMAAAASRTR